MRTLSSGSSYPHQNKIGQIPICKASAFNPWKPVACPTLAEHFCSIANLTVSSDTHDAQMEVEFFVLAGEIADENGSYPQCTYVRNPDGSSHAHSKMGCRLFVKLSQIHEEDQGRRVIDTGRESKWLPGPVEATEIYPLHMWDCESVFLIRWLATASFKPTFKSGRRRNLRYQRQTGGFPRHLP